MDCHLTNARGRQDPRQRPRCPVCSKGQPAPVLCRAGSTWPSFTYYYCPICRWSAKKPRPILFPAELTDPPPAPYVSPLSSR